MLYELLTGRRPFRGGNSLEVASALLEARLEPLPSSIPHPLERIVRRLLAVNPAERYKSAAEVGAALDAIARHDRPAPRLRTAMIALGLSSLIGVAGYLMWRTAQFHPLTTSEQRLVSTAEAPHRAPSLSPDATMLALVAPDAAGVPQIRVADLKAGTSIQITSGGVAASRPRWSPKGDQIVHGRAGQGIWSVAPLGGTPRRILATGVNPNFSADGARLVFEEDPGTLWTAAADGSDVRQIEGTSPLITACREVLRFRRTDRRSPSSVRRSDRTAISGSFPPPAARRGV